MDLGDMIFFYPMNDDRIKDQSDVKCPTLITQHSVRVAD